MNRLNRLSTKVFLWVLIFVIVPMYGMFFFMKSKYEQYILEELSTKIIQSISKSEQELYKAFQNMASISSILASDKMLIDTIKDPDKTYYQKTINFDTTINSMKINNLFAIDDLKITFFDLDKNVYSNWSTNYNNYSFLLNEDWVQESMYLKGHVKWSMFSNAYIGNQSSQKYISLARVILSDNFAGESIGTLIISIEQQELSEILHKFAYDTKDFIYVCIDNGEILLDYDPHGIINQQHIQRVFEEGEQRVEGGYVHTIDGKKYLISYYNIPEPWTFNDQQLRILHFTDYQGVTTQMEKIANLINMSMGLFLLILIPLAIFITIKIVRPIVTLSKQMKDYTLEHAPIPLNIQRRDEIGQLNRAFLKMSDNIKDLFHKLNLEHEVKEKYRFESLRAQLNPHFLFNTLNSIRWMALIRKADNIVESIDALANILKYSMNRGGELVTLEEELSNIRSYVFIQNCRYGDRYELEIMIDEEVMQLNIVKFILQPIVENAIIHGLKEQEIIGIIRIYGEIDIEENLLKLYVEDNGKGISDELLTRFRMEQEYSENEKKVTGIGIQNVHERIRITYGNQYGLEIMRKEERGTIVLYRLPVIIERKPNEENNGC